MNNFHSPQKKNTSWQKSGQWYNKLVGDKGHYYHQHVILPGVVRLLGLTDKSSLLDIGCGQGVLARQLPKAVLYTGIDLAPGLIHSASLQDHAHGHSYLVADVTKSLPLEKKDFTHATAVLSLQNMEHQEAAILHVGDHLVKNGRFVIVLNHPSFRIPRQSGWGISESKQQYRYINRYLTPLKIPITMHPGEKQSPVTWSFHYPISLYTLFLHNAGFVIEIMEEWASDKESVGKASKMENRARSEIPLFLTISARKI